MLRHAFSREVKRGRLRQLAVAFFTLCAGAMVCPSAFAYYHYVRFLARTGSVPVLEKYDLSALPNKTLFYYVSEQGPSAFATGDSLTAMLSQIQLAAKAWDDVETSDINLRFGGLTTSSAPQSGPGIDVVFSDDIPPGLIALGGVTSRGEAVSTTGETFVPITRSVVIFRKNLADRPSSSEAFFLTAVHEFGHALGLQHTLTSSVMSTSITRSTTKAQPLALDDRVGLSILYPARNFPGATAAIKGRVTMDNEGVNLASVVAIPPTGSAISTLTNPDGTYHLQGIPPGQYFLYVHPLPPALQGEATPANLVLPVAADGRTLAPGPAFDTVFFPGVKEPLVAVPLTAGAVLENVNFQVTRRASVPVSSVQTYGFLGQVTTKPPLLNRTLGRGTLVAAGNGLLSAPSTLAPGLQVAAIGGATGVVTGSLRPYAFSSAFLQLDVAFTPFSVDGPHHLMFQLGGDVHVLPSAFLVTSRQPPAINSIVNATDPTGARVVAITGSNFDRQTQFLFDGHPAAIRFLDETAGVALVSPPPAAGGHVAAVVALNRDGQSSLFVHGNNVPTYSYEGAEQPTLTISPALVSAGSETMVEIEGSGWNLIDGLARLGFGSSDILVRRVWVLSPNRLLANISVSAAAVGRSYQATLVNGLQTAHSGSISVGPVNPRQMMVTQAVHAASGSTFFGAGAPVSVTVANLPPGTPAASIALTLNDQAVPVVSVGANGQVNFVIPASLSPGPAVLRLRVGAEAALPIVLAIEPPPPAILSAQMGGAALDAGRAVLAGDTVTLLVAGLTADAFTGVVSNVSVEVGGVSQRVNQIAPSSQRGVYEVSFTLGPGLAPGPHPLTVSQDGRVSSSFVLLVR